TSMLAKPLTPPGVEWFESGLPESAVWRTDEGVEGFLWLKRCDDERPRGFVPPSRLCPTVPPRRPRFVVSDQRIFSSCVKGPGAGGILFTGGVSRPRKARKLRHIKISGNVEANAFARSFHLKSNRVARLTTALSAPLDYLLTHSSWTVFLSLCARRRRLPR